MRTDENEAEAWPRGREISTLGKDAGRSDGPCQEMQSKEQRYDQLSGWKHEC